MLPSGETKCLDASKLPEASRIYKSASPRTLHEYFLKAIWLVFIRLDMVLELPLFKDYGSLLMRTSIGEESFWSNTSKSKTKNVEQLLFVSNQLNCVENLSVTFKMLSCRERRDSPACLITCTFSSWKTCLTEGHANACSVWCELH